MVNVRNYTIHGWYGIGVITIYHQHFIWGEFYLELFPCTEESLPSNDGMNSSPLNFLRYRATLTNSSLRNQENSNKNPLTTVQNCLLFLVVLVKAFFRWLKKRRIFCWSNLNTLSYDPNIQIHQWISLRLFFQTLYHGKVTMKLPYVHFIGYKMYKLIKPIVGIYIYIYLYYKTSL